MPHDSRSITPLAEADYDAIEAAVMETARGRWFLSEYATRNRNADTRLVLDAVARLEKAIGGGQPAAGLERVRDDLADMARTISQMKTDLDSSRVVEEDPSRFERLPILDELGAASRDATGSILACAEGVQEVAWDLRERTVDHEACDRLDRLATEIYAACGFQDVAARRADKVVQTIRFVEARIYALIDVFDSSRPQHAEKARTPAPALGMMEASIDDIVLVDAQIEPAPRRPISVDDDTEIDVIATEEAESTDMLGADMPPHLANAPVLEAEPMFLIDDTELQEVGFVDPVPANVDGLEDVAPPAPAPVQSAPVPFGATPEEPAEPVTDMRAPTSLAALDAMPTIQKAMIFG